jgi:hypothetical protein
MMNRQCGFDPLEFELQLATDKLKLELQQLALRQIEKRAGRRDSISRD